MSTRTTTYDVAIIGAGAAGLAATRDLAAAGRDVVVIEARDRIGGRIHTLCDPAFALPVELGAEFVHSRDGPVWELLRETKSTAYLADGDHHELRHRRLTKVNDFWGEVAKVFDRLKRLGRRDMSFAQFLRTCCKQSNMMRPKELSLAFIEGFNAADPKRISAQSIKAAEAESDSTEGSESFRLIDGYGALIDHLHESIAKHRMELKLGAVVRAVEWKRGEVRVQLAGDGSVRARCAIITIPIGVLNAGEGARGAIHFVPDIPAMRQAWRQIEMGPVIKVIASFTEPFWEDAEFATAPRDASFNKLAFMHSRQTQFPTWWTWFPMRGATLTAWAGGPAAQRLSLRPRAQIIACAIASLSQFTSMPERRLRRLLVRAHVHDWQADPFSRGAYSYIKVGGIDAPTVLSRPIERTLFFAGEATATPDEGLGGTVDAALATGRRATRQVLSMIR